MEIDLTKSGRENQLIKTQIINGKDYSEMKIWWRGYMETYRQEDIYAKKEISDKYGLMPPPPPPPKTIAWF